VLKELRGELEDLLKCEEEAGLIAVVAGGDIIL
jgi:hypothetical protein